MNKWAKERLRRIKELADRDERKQAKKVLKDKPKGKIPVLDSKGNIIGYDYV